MAAASPQITATVRLLQSLVEETGYCSEIVGSSESHVLINALRCLVRQKPGESGRRLAEVLATRPYHEYLLDPDTLTEAEALQAAVLLSQVDDSFYSKLTKCADVPCLAARVMRTLRIVQELGGAHVLVSWLRKLTDHPNQFLRSKAVHLICGATHNPTLVTKHLKSPNARTRANAVEVLWTIPRDVATPILLRAAEDLHHRVAVNALLGLFLHGVEDASGRLVAASRHESPQFRAAAAWAMGQTGDCRFQSDLERLAQDDSELVRTSAAKAIDDPAIRVPRQQPILKSTGTSSVTEPF